MTVDELSGAWTAVWAAVDTFLDYLWYYSTKYGPLMFVMAALGVKREARRAGIALGERLAKRTDQ
ncbi:hypothetical protein AB0O34_23965 [Sphaerisporangium sp. NPDC088356]|uniref:hypothetical protein n=1 Tax=Sphaerisporangium sp. NPDC088356 TaxID=3154871 RepID=UPI0034451754